LLKETTQAPNSICTHASTIISLMRYPLCQLWPLWRLILRVLAPICLGNEVQTQAIITRLAGCPLGSLSWSSLYFTSELLFSSPIQTLLSDKFEHPVTQAGARGHEGCCTFSSYLVPSVLCKSNEMVRAGNPGYFSSESAVFM
jgi:hypothetical protein